MKGEKGVNRDKGGWRSNLRFESSDLRSGEESEGEPVHFFGVFVLYYRRGKIGIRKVKFFSNLQDFVRFLLGFFGRLADVVFDKEKDGKVRGKKEGKPK